MNINLARAFMQKQVMQPGMVIKGRTPAYGLGGAIQKVMKNTVFENYGAKGFICRDDDGRRCLVDYDLVTAIDGMKPERLARVYNIKADGTAAKTGKKRGRKPKHLINNSTTLEAITDGKTQRTENNSQTQSTSA